VAGYLLFRWQHCIGTRTLSLSIPSPVKNVNKNKQEIFLDKRRQNAAEM